MGGQGGAGTVPFACPRVRPPYPVPTLRARSVPEAPPWDGVWLPGQEGRDFMTFPVKLVKTEECHQKSVIRPVIVPILKTGPKSRLLIFSDFRFSQPSLTRNYWACFDRTAVFIVKKTKCRQMCTPCTRPQVRERVARYPHVPRQQAVCFGTLLIWLSAVFSTRSFTLRN